MRVLVACEFSGTVRDAFSARGHDAWSCDILPTEAPGNHIQGDVRGVMCEGWDLMVAHPPCTYLARSGAHWLARDPQRNAKMIAAREFFLDLLNAPIPKKAIENPNPFSGAGLPQSTQRIEPYYFGDPYRKSTHLWLVNLPPLMATVQTSTIKDFIGTRRSPHARSKFFPGVSAAMAEQWGEL